MAATFDFTTFSPRLFKAAPFFHSLAVFVWIYIFFPLYPIKNQTAWSIGYTYRIYTYQIIFVHHLGRQKCSLLMCKHHHISTTYHHTHLEHCNVTQSTILWLSCTFNNDLTTKVFQAYYYYYYYYYLGPRHIQPSTYTNVTAPR